MATEHRSLAALGMTRSGWGRHEVVRDDTARQTGYHRAESAVSGVGTMSLDKDTVARIARLARLKVPEEELVPLAGELSGILAWIEQLNEVDTANIEPLASVSDVTLPMRADKVTDGGIADKVLANAPGGAVYIDPNDRK